MFFFEYVTVEMFFSQCIFGTNTLWKVELCLDCFRLGWVWSNIHTWTNNMNRLIIYIDCEIYIIFYTEIISKLLYLQNLGHVGCPKFNVLNIQSNLFKI